MPREASAAVRRASSASGNRVCSAATAGRRRTAVTRASGDASSIRADALDRASTRSRPPIRSSAASSAWSRRSRAAGSMAEHRTTGRTDGKSSIGKGKWPIGSQRALMAAAVSPRPEASAISDQPPGRGTPIAPDARMTKTQETAVAAGALTLGAALLARGMRAARALDFRDKVVVITGARGLALEMARQLGSEGARITIAARVEGELDRARQDLADRGIDAA